jgi:acyl carrier protein
MVQRRISVDETAGIIRRQLRGKLPNDAPVAAESTLEGLGLSSLDVTEIYFAIEERVGTELDPTAAADVKTIGELVEVVNDLVARASRRARRPSVVESGALS